MVKKVIIHVQLDQLPCINYQDSEHTIVNPIAVQSWFMIVNTVFSLTTIMRHADTVAPPSCKNDS